MRCLAVLLRLVPLVGLLAACGAPVGEVRDEGIAQRGGATLAVPDGATAAGTTSVASSTPQDPVRTVEAPPATTVVYLIRYGRLEAVARPTTGTVTLRDSLDSLLAGPSAAELSLGYRTAIPRGTRLRSAEAANGVATIDLTAAVAGDRSSVGFDEDQVLALAQLVYTATELPDVTAVRFLVEGHAAGSVLGDALADGRLTRDQIGAVLVPTLALDPQTVCAEDGGAPQADPLVVTRPRDGAKVRTTRIVVTGRLAPDRRVLVTRVIHDGDEIVHEIAPACTGTFRQELPLPAGLTGTVVLELYTPAKDGTRDGLVTRTVTVG